MDWLSQAAAHLTVACFFAGLAGSVCVVLLSAAEDVRQLFRNNDEADQP